MTIPDVTVPEGVRGASPEVGPRREKKATLPSINVASKATQAEVHLPDLPESTPVQVAKVKSHAGTTSNRPAEEPPASAPPKATAPAKAAPARMSRRAWVWVCAGALWAACIPVAVIALRKQQQGEEPTSNVPLEEELIQLANQARLDNGLPVLREDQALNAVARAHAERMARDKKLAFPEAIWLEQKLHTSGYPFMMWGMAIDLVHDMSLPDAFKNWVQVPQTGDEVLNQYYADLGAGVYRDTTTGALFVVLVFGKRKLPKKRSE
ncbi:MAG: CAP domain-containing protein [Gemmataceae bacterium]|nr:CAP domain-containing protein [Gemmataceae bacterium]